MNLEEFKDATKDQIKEYGDKIALGYQYDDNNNKFTYKSSTGFWDEYTYDDYYNELTYKNSNGIDSIFITKGDNYTLRYDIKTKNYIAGCQNLSYNECIEFFDKFKNNHADAELFMITIKEHHKTVV